MIASAAGDHRFTPKKMRDGVGAMAVVAVVACHIVGKLQARLMPELVGGGCTDTSPQAFDQLFPRLRVATGERPAAGGRQFGMVERVGMNAANRRDGIGHPDGPGVHGGNGAVRAIRRLLDSDQTRARNVLAELQVEAGKCVLQRLHRRATNERLLLISERVYPVHPAVLKHYTDLQRPGRAR